MGTYDYVLLLAVGLLCGFVLLFVCSTSPERAATSQQDPAEAAVLETWRASEGAGRGGATAREAAGRPPRAADAAGAPAGDSELTGHGIGAGAEAAAGPEAGGQGEARVSGRVVGSRGEPIAGHAVDFASAQMEARYSAVTDESGRFEIEHARIGSGYRLSVQAVGGYGAHIQDQLALTSKGLDVRVVLEPVATGGLHGRMVDVNGNALPNLALRLESAQVPGQFLEVEGDAQGYFVLENVPAGELRFTTRSVPTLSVRGVVLPPRMDKELLIVLDLGDHSLSGRLTDDRGNPVSGARLILSWSHMEHGFRSSSVRTASSDQDGFFAFEDLGPGSHRLGVQAAGHRELQVSRDVFGATQVDLELRRASR